MSPALLPATDTDAWAETMTDALTNPQSYHTKAFNLYRSVVDTRSLTTMLRSTKAIYESSNKLLVTTARS